MAVRQFDERVLHVGIGFDAIHLACSDQAGKARPILLPSSCPAKRTLRRYMAGALMAFLHDEVGIEVDTTVIKEKPTGSHSRGAAYQPLPLQAWICVIPVQLGLPGRRKKPWKTHLSSDRTSCSKANDKQMRLTLDGCAYWIWWKLRSACPKRSLWRRAQFEAVSRNWWKFSGGVLRVC